MLRTPPPPHRAAKAHQTLIAEPTPEQRERYVERISTTQSLDEVFASSASSRP